MRIAFVDRHRISPREIQYIDSIETITTTYSSEENIDNNVIAVTNRDSDQRNTVSINSTLSLKAGLIFAKYC